MKNKKTADLPWVGYIRVSTEEQAESGLSLEAQEHKVLALAVARGIQLARVYSDPGFSAKSLERPAMASLIADIESGAIGGVVIAKLDRITRSVADLGRLVDLFGKADVPLVSCDGTADTSTAAGRMVMNLVATVAQWEREVICERTRDALQAKLRRGEHAGNIPYGYRKQRGRSVPDDTEQANIALMKRLRSEGMVYKEIAASLNDLNATTRRGSPWTLSRVERVLKNAETEAASAI